jgi:magnesium-transporting ATPase (P-type)
MMAKSLICSGFGKAIIVAVGTRTVAGVITEKTQKPQEETLLQEKLGTIADKIGNVGTAVATLTFFAQLIRLILEMNGYMECGTTNIFAQEHIEGCEPLTWRYESGGENRFYTEIL